MHTIDTTLYRTGDSIAVSTGIDDMFFPLQLGVKYPESGKKWSVGLQGRMHSIPDPLADEPDLPAKDDRTIGTDLASILFSGIDRRKYISPIMKSMDNVVINIKTNDIDLSALPWESCVHANWQKLDMEEVSSLKLAVVRTPTSFTDKWTIKNSEKLNILIVGTSAKNSSNPNFTKERDFIRDKLAKSKQPDTILNFESIDNASIPELQRKIREVNPHIIHLVSHGDRAMFELEDAGGNSIHYTAPELVMLLSQDIDNVSLFVSTACLSMQDHVQRNIPSIGRELVKHIPYILGMQVPITPQQAIDFSQDFYASLAAPNSLLNAYIYARNALFQRKPKSPEWVGPVLYKSGYQDPRFFSSSHVYKLTQIYIEEVHNHLIGLRDAWMEIDDWKNLNKLINQIELNIVDAKVLEKFTLKKPQSDEWQTLKSSIQPIRSLVITIQQKLKSGEDLGKPISEVLDKLSGLVSLLHRFSKSFDITD